MGEGYVITLNQTLRYYNYNIKRNSDIVNFVNYSIPTTNLMNNATDDVSNTKTYLVDRTTRSWIMTFSVFFPGTNNWMNIVIVKHCNYLLADRVSRNRSCLRR